MDACTTKAPYRILVTVTDLNVRYGYLPRENTEGELQGFWRNLDFERFVID